MAYLLEISKPRCRCGKPARVQLFNRYNGPAGEFCKACGQRELKRMQIAEDSRSKCHSWSK